MKIKSILALTAIGALLTFSARADIIDNFDSYANEAAFDAAWVPSTGVGIDLYTGASATSPNSVKNPGTTAQASRRFDATGVSSLLLDFSYDLYDFDASNSARDFIQVQSRAGTAFTGALNQLVAIGKDNTIAGTKYFGRVAFASGATYGDGIGTVTATWFQLNAASPDKAIGWHNAQILGMADPANTGMVRYEFWLDGILGGSVNNVNNSTVTYNWLVLGSAVSTAPSAIAIDNVNFVTVPEPSMMALGLVGGLGLLCVLRRRLA